MKLPEGDDAAVAAWVRERLAEMDDTPRNKMWRTRAQGMPFSVAMSYAPTIYRLDLRIPVGEMRVLNDVAKSRGLPTRTYLRRAVATVMVACDGVDPSMIPSMVQTGLIGPP